MRYSDFSKDEFTAPIYNEVAEKILTLAKDEETKRKIERHIV